MVRKGVKIICHLETTWRERRTLPAEQPLSVRRGCVGTVIHVTTVSAPLVLLSLLTTCRRSAIRTCAPPPGFTVTKYEDQTVNMYG